MRSKIYFPAVLAIAFIFTACSTGEETKTATDSTGGNKHGLSVSNQSNALPHAVKDSIYDGEHIERYDNGVIYMRGEVKGGLRHGEWLTFYRDGKLWSKGTYKDGFREGYGYALYANGAKSQEGYYKHDKMVGKWTFWDEYGNKKEKDFGGQ